MQRIALLSLALMPVLASAEPWFGEAGLGVLTTSGNSETRSINGKFSLDYQKDRWHDTFQSQAINAADGGETTSERYVVTNKLDFTFYQRNYAFLATEFEKDMFGAIRERTSETVGFGRHFITGPRHFLDAELGGGARQQTEQETRIEDSDLIGRFAVDYRYQLSEANSFRQQVKVESGEANTFTQSLSELKLYVIGRLFASITFTVQNNSDVGPDVKPTDSTTAVNLSYAFGEKPSS